MSVDSLIFRKWVVLLGVGIGGCSVSGYSAESDALETAKKDLQTLPSSEVTAPSGEAGIDGKKFDFSLSSPSAGSGARPTTPTTEPAVSQGWLLDALQKPAASGDGRLGTAKEIANAKTEERLQANRETAKTWSPYLQQWLLPQNRNLTSGGLEFGASTRDRNAGDDFLRAQVKSKAALSVSEPLSGNATYHDPLAQRPNPYLEENSTTNAWPSKRDFTSSPPGQTNSPATGSSHPFAPVTSDPYPRRGDNNPDVAKKSDPPLPPPTTPLVNEQKYFPQLNRF